MKKVFGLGVLSLAAMGMLIGVFAGQKNEIKEASAIGNYSTNASTYYNSITATSGKQLAAQLHDLITSTHGYYTSYADNGANLYQQKTDQYYEGNTKVNGYIYEFYSGVKWPNGWAPNAGDTDGGYNREHCWCQSLSSGLWGETGGGADMHHLRPVETRLNSTRGNNLYGEISNRDSNKVYAKYGTNTTYALGGYNNGGVFEPLDSKKGDVARIILYTYLHYNSKTVTSLFGSYATTNGSGSSSYFKSSLLSLTNVISKSSESAALELLLSWNSSDPVDDIERRRNEQVAVYQGNRNPFIDNSSYADAIWGTGAVTPTVNSVSVSPTTLELDLNGSTTGNLTATVNVSNGAAQTVNWTSSNTHVATVSSSGVVTAVAKGSCTITATSTVNANKSASCSVVVADTSGSSSEPTEHNATMAAGTNGSTVSVNSKDAIKVGTNSSGGDMTITVGAGAATLKLYAAAWKGVSGLSLNITGATVSPSSINLTADDGISNNSPFTLSGSESNYQFTINLSGITTDKTLTFTSSASKRFVVWGAVYYIPGASSRVLSSISLNTSNVQTEFYVGDTFDYSGLVTTAYFEDQTEDIVTPSSVSSPDMSTSGNKTITVTYIESGVSKTATYTISVLEPQVTEISASVNRLYYVGDRIPSTDVYVEDNLGNVINNFTLSENNYQFQYEDSNGGGFQKGNTLHVSYNELSTTFDAFVVRRNYTNPTNRTITFSADNDDFDDITGTGNSSASTYRLYDNDVTFVTTDSYNYYDNLSFKTTYVSSNTYHSDSVFYNETRLPTPIVSVSYQLTGSKQVNIDATISYSKDGINWSTTNDGDCYYFKLWYDGNFSGYITFSSISIELSDEENPTNVADYIMYNDTEGQCLSRIDPAISKLNDMTNARKSEFWTSNDYVISTARERLQAWARSQGTTLTFTNNEFAASNQSINVLFEQKDNSTPLVIVVVSSLSILAISLFAFKYKKKED